MAVGSQHLPITDTSASYIKLTCLFSIFSIIVSYVCEPKRLHDTVFIRIEMLLPSVIVSHAIQNIVSNIMNKGNHFFYGLYHYAEILSVHWF